jgi:transposase
MKTKDARTLSPEAQEELRMRAVAACEMGMTQAEAASALGITRYSVIKWVAAHREGGEAALKARKKGPPKGHGSLLSPRQAASVARTIEGKCPEQLRLPFVLWTREAMADLVWRRYGFRLARTTAGNYLRDWGFTPQKPVRRAYEQDPEAVRTWREETYPRIVARAKREKAAIYWGDESGLRSDHQAGRSYGKKGQTPVIPGTGQRFRCNMISALTNRGRLCFMVFLQRFRNGVFLDFLRRLAKHSSQKVFLIVDGHPVHRSKAVAKWLSANPKVEIFFLPGYSPELNPDELVNQDVKSNALGRRRPKNQREMIGDTRSYLRSTQKRPDVVRSYFRGKHVLYAA